MGNLDLDINLIELFYIKYDHNLKNLLSDDLSDYDKISMHFYRVFLLFTLKLHVFLQGKVLKLVKLNLKNYENV